MKPINKKYKNIGLATSLVLNGAVFLLIPFIPSCDIEADPPFPTETIVMEMDFSASGGGASGGSPSIAEETASSAKEVESNSKTESTESESNVKESNVTQAKPKENKGDGQSTSTTENPKNDFGNLFGSGGGNDGGNGSGTGTGVGPGTGPTIGQGGVGSGDGRTVVSKPTLVNPTQEEGRVMVEVTIDQDGNVTKVVAKRSHSKTTTSNEALIKEAEKLAKQFKFSKDYSGPVLQSTVIAINFTLE
jgi:TonB family protein